MIEKLIILGFRIDTKENWESNNPILINGEGAISIDSNGNYTLKIGYNNQHWSDISEGASFSSLKEIKDYIDSTIEAKDKVFEKIVVPYSEQATLNNDFSCSSSIDNTVELNSYISSLASNETIRFTKGNYIIKDTINIGDRKIIFDHGATFTCSNTDGVETPFINSNNGIIENGYFIYSGVQNSLYPCIISNNNTTVKNCYFKDFAVSIKGYFIADNNYIDNATNVFKIIPTGNSVIKNNYFNGTNSMIDTLGKNIILNNFVREIKLIDSTGSISAGNFVVIPTTSTVGNKVNDISIA